MAKLVVGSNKTNIVPALLEVTPDDFQNYLTIFNVVTGENDIKATELATACNQISQFLYGTNNG